MADSSYRKHLETDSTYVRVYYLKALNYSDSAYVLTRDHKMKTAKLQKIHYDSVHLQYKLHMDSSLKRIKSRRLPDSSIKSFKQKIAPKAVESIDQPTAFSTPKKPRAICTAGDR